MVVETAGVRHAAAGLNRYLWWRQQGRVGARRLPFRSGGARAPVRVRGNASWASVSELICTFAVVVGYFRFSQLIRSVDDCVEELFGLSYIMFCPLQGHYDIQWSQKFRVHISCG